MEFGGGLCRPRHALDAGLLGLALLIVGQARADWRIKQMAHLDRGQEMTIGRVVPYRLSQDSSPMLIFSGDIPFYHGYGLYFYHYVPMNRYRLLKVDTCSGSGSLPGDMIPWQEGDVNPAGPPELLAFNGYSYMSADLYSPEGRWGCPDSLAWSQIYDSSQEYSGEPLYITDLDQDGKKEIFVWDDARQHAYLYENVGQNLFHIVWEDFTLKGYEFAFGDFDSDDTMEFATADPLDAPNNWITILKCTGDNQYVHWDSVLTALPNGDDVFAARNLDGSNRAVLFVSFIDYANGNRTYLYTFEPTQGNKGYQAFFVDSSVYSGDLSMCASSCCADIDGDGLDEVLWSCGDHVQAYRCTGPHQFERIWSWSQDSSQANVTAYDVNSNGYNEIIESGSGQTNIFEIEAIRVLNPNTSMFLHPGDTCRIRWETFNPPRCDSVSLFLMTDTGWSLADTLVHALPPGDTNWLWTVPNIRSGYCHVVAIAYGPGWQYDESDTFFQILPLGVEESAAPPVRETRLIGAFPNPLTAATSIQFQLKEQGLVNLRICDVTGRTVATLADGVMKSGVYHRDWQVAPTVPDGVYFLDFTAGAYKTTRKLVIAR